MPLPQSTLPSPTMLVASEVGLETTNVLPCQLGPDAVETVPEPGVAANASGAARAKASAATINILADRMESLLSQPAARGRHSYSSHLGAAALDGPSGRSLNSVKGNPLRRGDILAAGGERKTPARPHTLF